MTDDLSPQIGGHSEVNGREPTIFHDEQERLAFKFAKDRIARFAWMPMGITGRAINEAVETLKFNEQWRIVLPGLPLEPGRIDARSFEIAKQAILPNTGIVAFGRNLALRMAAEGRYSFEDWDMVMCRHWRYDE